jgi:hypothetical protein
MLDLFNNSIENRIFRGARAPISAPHGFRFAANRPEGKPGKQKIRQARRQKTCEPEPGKQAASGQVFK